jgi:hypothetical protein
MRDLENPEVESLLKQNSYAYLFKSDLVWGKGVIRDSAVLCIVSQLIMRL